MTNQQPSLNNQEVQMLRVGLLYGQSTATQAAGVVNALIYVFISKELVPSSHLLIWFIFVFALFTLRIGVQKWFNSTYLNSKKSFDTNLWENIFATGALLSGLCWGVAGTALLAQDQIAQQAFFGFLLAGTTAGATVAYCTSVRAIQMFLLPSVLPFALRLFIEGGDFHYGMAGMLILYVVLISFLMKRMNQHVVNSICLQFEKDQLMNELKEAQSQITHTAKMAALGVMAGGISHEINNPLTAIQLNGCVLRDLAIAKKLTDEKATELAATIDSTVMRIVKIINGLKAFARDGKQDELELVAVDKIINETLEFCQTRFLNHGIKISIGSIGANATIQCRRVQIGQVLLNLLNNAFDAVDGTPDAWVKIDIEKASGQTHIAVINSGAKIPAELRDKIMQPFFTTKDVGKGMGLGLSISYGIMKSHGGALSLDENYPYTRFVLNLPAVNPAS